MAKTANEEILNATIRHQIKLLRFSQGEAQTAASLLAESDAELVKLLQSGLTETSEARIRALLAEVRRMRVAVAEQIQSELQEDMDGLAKTEADWEVSMLQGATPVAVAFSSVPPVVLKAVSGSPINGIQLEGWLGKMAANDVSRIEQQIRLGVLQGETIDQMVARIRGTKANGYKDGVLETTRREAEMIARTATNHVSTAARQATWDANADVIRGVRWVATLDGRTSPVCQSRDGEVYPIDKGPRPPAHPNCRSTVAPVLHGEEIVGDRPTITDTRTRRQREIDFRQEAKDEAGDAWKGMTAAERNAAIKARRDKWADENIGQAPSSTNYQTWLKGQSKEFQDEVLGKGKAQLFRDGMPLEKFVDEKGKPYSLAELKAELEGDKLNVVQPGVGLKAKSLLQQGMSPAQVLDQIKAEYPDASTSMASIASYKSELNKAGALNLGPAAQVPAGALKQAKAVADVVSDLDNSLAPNLKHAIGGQWSTVVDDLDGAPGVYGYYQAGKGVMLSGKKLSALPLAQAKQVAAHELGHLLHKQHDLLLPDDVLAAMKASAKGLSPDARKLYSYYLTSTDELVAEIYAQAMSPSTLTSQGLSAVEFNKAFGPAVQAAKDAMAKKFPVPAASAKTPLPGGPVMPFEVAGKHTSVGSLAKALLQQGMPDDQVLKSVLAEFPDAKTKLASISSYKSELKKQGLLPNKAAAPVVNAKVLPDVVPVPASSQAAIAAPEVVAAQPSALTLTSSQLKDEAIKLMQKGVLDNKSVAETLAKQFPTNAANIKITNIATWKSSWKKASPIAYRRAIKLGEAVEKVSKAAGPTTLPKLAGKTLGPVSTKALEKAKSLLAAGATPSEVYAYGFKPIFGVIKEPGASDLLELAQYQVGTIKAGAKPYLNAAYKAKPTTTPKPAAPKPAAPKPTTGSGSSWTSPKAYGNTGGVDMAPSRPASSPREGFPPPPRFTEHQRHAAVKAYLRRVDAAGLASVNEKQVAAGLELLTEVEYAAINGYTGSLYRQLNTWLRNGVYASDYTLQAYVEAAQSGLNKLARHTKQTVRGVPVLDLAEQERLLKAYRPGAVLEESAFMSSSYGGKVKKAFQSKIQMRINGHSGVNVTDLSQFGSAEAEILFRPGLRFRVDSVTEKDGTYWIEVTELLP